MLVDYDDDSRIRRIRWKDGATTTTLVDTIAYRAHGPVSSMLYGDGYTQTRTYDQSYRQIGVTDLKSGSPALRQLTYGYEGRDNLASISDALVPVNSETFGYTPREHLTSANGPYGSLGFTYDGVGNRLTQGKGAVTDSYAYPATSNRLSSITLGAGGSRPFTYDGAGNVITDTRSGTVYGYTYNSAGRLSALSVGGVTQATYRYDAMGRQVTRTLVPSGVTIHSVFDAQGRRIAEYNEATGAIIREYVWMGWDPVAVIEGGVIYLIRADHIGRPSFATTLAGTKVWSAVYLPYGGVHVTTGAPIEADPLGLVDGASVYGYALQNPGRYTDPRGESSSMGPRPPSPLQADTPDGLCQAGWKEDCHDDWQDDQNNCIKDFIAAAVELLGSLYKPVGSTHLPGFPPAYP